MTVGAAAQNATNTQRPTCGVIALGIRPEPPCDSSRFVGHSESDGINRHVVGDERALQEREQRIHPGLESCRRYREVSLEA